MFGPVKPAPAVVQEVPVPTAGGYHHGLLAPNPRHAGEHQGSGGRNISIVSQSFLKIFLIQYIMIKPKQKPTLSYLQFAERNIHCTWNGPVVLQFLRVSHVNNGGFVVPQNLNQLVIAHIREIGHRRTGLGIDTAKLMLLRYLE